MMRLFVSRRAVHRAQARLLFRLFLLMGAVALVVALARVARAVWFPT
jgi:hypothetical protein